MMTIIHLENDPLKRYFKSFEYKELYPFDKIFVIGITGSCGKTSTSLYIYHFLKNHQVDVCYIGTHKILYKNLQLDTSNTTLEIDQLYDYFIKNCIFPKIIVMEVSSHGINLARINCFHFHLIGLTNLGQDHLDFHLNQKNYHNVKKAFLNNNSQPQKVFIPLKYKSKEFKNCQYYEVNQEMFDQKKHLPYDYQNLYLAYLILKEMKYDEKMIIEELNNTQLLNGRGEIIYHHQQRIIIDYAHQVESFEAILNNQNFNKVVIFGCGGNREKQKRMIMGKIAEKYCKYVIITEDNSRNEDLMDIIHDITSQMSNYTIIKDRQEAIRYALNNYKDIDIYILGKGDEEFIEKNHQKIYFNDKKEVLKIIMKR